MAGDSSGVSEVVGFLLTFAILSIMLVMAMYAFGVAAKGAQTQAVELHAESAATRVAGVIVEAAVLAEQQAATGPTLAYVLDLPDQLEGRSYTVRLEAASGGEPDLVRVLVPALDIDVTAPVFAAAAPTTVNICTTEVGGGDLTVLYDDPGADNAALPGDTASCGGGAGAKFIFIGEGP